jgi:hypothetical protein
MTSRQVAANIVDRQIAVRRPLAVGNQCRKKYITAIARGFGRSRDPRLRRRFDMSSAAQRALYRRFAKSQLARQLGEGNVTHVGMGLR